MLGDLPSEVAATAREKIADGLYNYRKRRMALLVTHQSVTNLLKFYPADAFSTLVTIDLDQKTGAKIGTLYDPKGAVDFESMKVKASNLDMRFEPFLANHLECLEDRA